MDISLDMSDIAVETKDRGDKRVKEMRKQVGRRNRLASPNELLLYSSQKGQHALKARASIDTNDLVPSTSNNKGTMI